jgi:hypothetical protein
MKPWYKYTESGINDLAFEALNAACLSIQDALGQTTGDMAGIFFSGENEEKIMEVLREYVRLEIATLETHE